MERGSLLLDGGAGQGTLTTCAHIFPQYVVHHMLISFPLRSGDLIMGLAWCLPTGFDSPIPYFYFVYFAILLIHRQSRDDEMCEHK